MRHLWSFIAGLVAAPVVWVLLGLGQFASARTISIWETNRRIEELRDLGAGPDTAPAGADPVDLVGPAAFLVAAGVILGLLATLRISPAGPLVAGVLLAAPYVALFVDPYAVSGAIPTDRELFGQPMSLRLPLDTGTLLVVGVLLLMAGFSVQRWRRRQAVGAGGTTAYPPGDEGRAPQPSAPAGPPEAGWARPPDTGSEPAPGAAEPASASPSPVSPSAAEPSATVPPTPAPAPAEPVAGRPPEPEWPPPPDRPAEEPGRLAPPAESPWIAPPRPAHRDGPAE